MRIRELPVVLRGSPIRDSETQKHREQTESACQMMPADAHRRASCRANVQRPTRDAHVRTPTAAPTIGRSAAEEPSKLKAGPTSMGTARLEWGNRSC